ncbi:transmembrane protein 270 [Choloepus didactylus]|uniref:transmembrane protein 270 n=1 Tax=Choloepus didactylus TaxID=27675 RepID=UPI0018A016C3|nr:transmembrane protein 270 [Choloepus didactylus]XP_037670961.1 transmembrane protein 270 [Choloepus didactylus]XP_037670963.1 transmembrane protein 270 [Choloepus didactylus]XP_037670964.1 transmembrane protein 270 [Choloepus didactylus]XP_037670965.1 transmembrane protein 270 [Choloepus didactylus]XP_037670966.1 transmembrane protein 270 [Choloepus didactylus]XP_037670967.1 transmembrane protein 270 [Choloepus didactylus]XP_037670968.1 transmembrane protein 270 [Choloepus didactylus]XP_
MKWPGLHPMSWREQELIQNRAHLYNLLLLKIIHFNHWVSGLAQEAQGSCSRRAHPPPAVAACLVGRALRAGLALVEVPVWLVLRVPRLAWAGVLGCSRALGLAPQWLDTWEQLGLSAATWTDLLLSCLHSLLLAALLLLLLAWRLCWMAHRLGQLPGKALLENRVVLELLALPKRLYCRVASLVALTSWHLAYLVTWTTCLASHLLQAAFEHTVQLAKAQEAKPPEASGPLSELPLPESMTPEAGAAPPERETLGE